MVRQKVPKSYFQSQFSMSKINGFKKKIFEEYQFRDHFFLTSIVASILKSIFPLLWQHMTERLLSLVFIL